MENLIELQNIDTKLRDLNDLLGDLPSKVEELNTQEEDLQTSIVTKKERLKKIGVETHKLEVKNSGFDDKIGKLKDQLFLVTNNKQYDALMNEIDHLKTEKSSFETDILNFLEETESLNDSLTSIESTLGDLTEDLSIRRGKLEHAISESANEKTSLESKRKKELSGIEDTIISQYEKIMGARDGLAVVSLSGTSCGGCGATVPMQKITEIRAKIQIHRCDVCARFLYSEKISKNK
jgi:predicted  nucleic acid-binding Zn-ribbon protein